MVEAAEIGPDERVLEIGTGRGALTKELVSLGRAFEGYEVDRGNIQATLAAVSEARGKVKLADALRERPRFDVLVASLPYSKSAAFVEWLSGMQYRRAVVLLQEDFVKKVQAKPGARDYRGISALAQLSSEIAVVRRVGRGAFSPPPRVSSLIVRFTPRMQPSKAEVSTIKLLFTLRRRRVQSALAELGKAGEGYGDRRVFSLTPAEVHSLCAPKNAS